MEITETEPGTRWSATDGTHEAQALVGRLSRSFGWLSVDEQVPVEATRELATALRDAAGVPLLAKAVPGTPRHTQLLAVDAAVFQVCPPSEVDGSEPATAAWANESLPAGATLGEVAGLDAQEILDLWIRVYTWVHAGWSPLEDEVAAREIFGPMLAEDLALELSVLVLRDGIPTAVALSFREPEGPVCVVTEAVDPDAPSALEDVGAAMRAAVRRTADAGEPMFFDGHVSDPHYPRILETIPHVTGAGLHLLRFT